MYIPASFAEERIGVLHDFIRRHDFATLVTNGKGGLSASHVPMILLSQRGQCGSLQFHLARQNEHWKTLAAADALAIFHGPHGYISPRWYKNPISVPTWNYIIVHASGRARMLGDDELSAHLDALVANYESASGWTTGALPPDARAKLAAMVVGFEMEITQIQGKCKLGQNRTREDREGAIEGLRAVGTPEAMVLADCMAATLKKED